MPKDAGSAILLHGKAVRPDGTASETYLLLRGGRIERIAPERPLEAGDATCVELDDNDWIFPGLLDLHTHTGFNFLPLWEAPGRPYENRFHWRSDYRYAKDVRGLIQFLKRPPWSAEDEERDRVLSAFSELQAIAGGTTTLQESHSLEEEVAVSEPVLCRSTANHKDLGIPEGHRVFSVIDLFKPDEETDEPGCQDWAFEEYVRKRDAGRLQATLVHLAEGRSGFAGDRGVDPYSRKEFEAFMSHPALEDAERVRSSPFSIIHGCGIDVEDERHLAFLRDRGISVIWSPVSNLLLYGDTLDVERLLASGVNVALGSDWSPSGSKHVWDEAKFARFYFEAIGSAVSDLEVFRMATVNAARCLGKDSPGTGRLGCLTEGALADLFILRSPLASGSPLEVFFKTEDRHVRAVFVGGVPLYGQRELLEPFGRDVQDLPEREGSAARGKVVHLPSGLVEEDLSSIDIEPDVNELEDRLKASPCGFVKRSNLLASSDVPYQDRIVRLRGETILYGDRVRKSRRERRNADSRSS